MITTDLAVTPKLWDESGEQARSDVLKLLFGLFPNLKNS